jgi:hypothetical protein
VLEVPDGTRRVRTFETKAAGTKELVLIKVILSSVQLSSFVATASLILGGTIEASWLFGDEEE